MIAPYLEQAARQSDQSQRAHTIAVGQANSGIAEQINRVLVAKPVVSLAVAVGLGVTLGWLVKRKKW